MDAEAMTNACMEQLDGDGDGFLTKKEMESAPGLLFAAADLDIDPKDDKLSRAEILARFQLYVELNVGFQALSPKVVFPNGRPVEDAEIEMVPEPFMADYIETATGSVIDVDTGDRGMVRGYGFSSVGRYAQSGLIAERFAPQDMIWRS